MNVVECDPEHIAMGMSAAQPSCPFRRKRRTQKTGLNPSQFDSRRDSRVAHLIILILLIAASTVTVEAERLPIKIYTTADGLAHNSVIRIVRDSHGFLWFCTLGGLSRFDGYTFTNYGAEQGLHGQVADVLETRQGDYWVATLSGLYRFYPKPSRRDSRGPAVGEGPSPAPMFEMYRLTSDTGVLGVNTVREDRRGTIWVGTNAGLYQLTQAGSAFTPRLVDIGAPDKGGNKARVLGLFEDDDGAMWVSLPGNGVRRLLSDGHIDSDSTRGLHPQVCRMLQDHQGRLWVGTERGLILLTRQPSSSTFEVRRTYTSRDGLLDDYIGGLLESSDGNVWVGTSTGLSQFCAGLGCGKQTFRSYAAASLAHFGAYTLAEDREGNLWIGNEVGALRIARDGFTTYDESDGLGSSRVSSVAEDSSGRVYVVTQNTQGGDVNLLDGSRFHRISPRLPKLPVAPGASSRQPGLQDPNGDWWLATDFGLVRYARVKRPAQLANAEPTAVYSQRNGLPSEIISSLYPDSRGDVWIGSSFYSSPNGALTRWQRTTKTLHVYGLADGLTASTAPVSFCEDRAGNLWVGFIGHNLARYRDDHFTVFAAADGLPPGSIWNIYLDHGNRVWVATTEGGVARINNPSADHPAFVAYTTAEGLSSNQVQAITEDQWGRIYLLTDKGVDRLDPLTGSVKHFTVADGLVTSSHWGVAFRDHTGALWFGTLQGLSRLIPKREEAASPPAIRISSVRIRGQPRRISELGETRIADLVLQPNQNNLQVDFGSLNFGIGDVLRYQYMLLGVDRDWSHPTDQRTVNFATLSPGSYRFLVRAVNWKGLVSSEPAEMDFQLLPPLWRRWWVLGLFGVLVLSTVYALYRFRLGQFLELERVRTRIATDLHDDIGSNLTQISILSEVVRRKVGQDSDMVSEPLMRIADLSRELVDSMSDIVWAVNPRRDHIGDLAQRMRRFASDVLSARNIEFKFHTLDGNLDKEMRADKRRQVFLVFKEGINNIVRHSGSKGVTIELGVEKAQLVLKLCDDGQGFDPAKANGNTQGHGLESMAERARSIGGEFNLESRPGQGTAISLRIPL
jgi:ligand-binding sensor domain-containing protein/two-component sensor histidine kinase